MMRPQIVLFGDSMTNCSFERGGWGASLAHRCSRQADVLIRGYAGYNTRWSLLLLPQIFPKASATPPVAVTICFGTADAAVITGSWRGVCVTVEEYKENLIKIVQHIKDVSIKTCIVLITPPPIDDKRLKEYYGSFMGSKANTPDSANEVIGEYAKQCVSLAEEIGVPSIDLWSKMQETANWQKTFLGGGLHLTPEGHAFVYKEIRKVFSEASVLDLPFDFPQCSEVDEENPEKTLNPRKMMDSSWGKFL